MDDQQRTPEIVVGVDGSEASIEALRRGQWLASAMNARLVAMACWDYPNIYAGYAALGIDGFQAGARQILEEAVDTAFGPHRPENLEVRLVQGTPKVLLVEASRESMMLVVGRQGHNTVGRLLLGSVSSACVAHAHCPVLVVHPAGQSGREPAGAGSRPETISI